MKRILALLPVVVIACGCATAKCDKTQPYQRVRPVEPLTVPDDLSEPPVRSRAPEVTSNEAPRRPDGRCLDEPPPYVAPSANAEPGNS